MRSITDVCGAKNFFFDFDGTVADTQTDIILAWKAALKESGIECPNFDSLYKTGPTMDETARMISPGISNEAIAELKNRFKKAYDGSGFPITKPYPCAEKMLHDIANAGRRSFIATNKRTKPLMFLLEKFDLKHFFTGIYSSDMTEGRIATKTESLQNAFRDFGISKTDALMIGDTKGDIDAAHTAGIPVAAVAWGYGTESEFSEADIVIDRDMNILKSNGRIF